LEEKKKHLDQLTDGLELMTSKLLTLTIPATANVTSGTSISVATAETVPAAWYGAYRGLSLAGVVVLDKQLDAIDVRLAGEFKEYAELSNPKPLAISGETAEALSGMARAFFYAGARTLLVS